MSRPRVVVVTGGGRGIGAAIAEELGRTGAVVVTADPLVAIDGSAEAAVVEEPSTAERIVAAGGSARASAVSVTDAAAVDGLFADLVAEFGAVDAVVNVAGISRPTGFAAGDEGDWRAVIEVHLGGYLNVLRSALPRMAAAGHGRIVGVTSGSGWRAANAGAYGVAKRAIAALTWQLGRQAPPGVTVNALSPIALTRMALEAIARAGAGRSGASGGLALTTGMPEPEAIGPFGAHLTGPGLEWCTGQVLFGGGTELAVVEPPRLLEVVQADEVTARTVVATALSAVLGPAEATQRSAGGGNPRLTGANDGALDAGGLACGVIVPDPALAAAVGDALRASGARVLPLDPATVTPGFAGATAAVRSLADQAGHLDALVVAAPGEPEGAPSSDADWDRVLTAHEGLVAGLVDDAAWARAAADHTAETTRPLRLVMLTDASTPGAASRAQAVTQLTRAARGATEDRVGAYAVTLTPDATPVVAGELVAQLVVDPDAAGLSGAELAVGPGWFGLSAHPRPGTSVALAGTAVPDWFDDVLRSAVAADGLGPEARR